MGKLSTLVPVPVAVAAPKTAIRTRSTSPDTQTYEGGDGYTRKPKSELFLLAVANMVGEDTFYEKADARDKRYRDLIAKVTAKDPEWIRRFVPFLRDRMHMRTASIVMAVEYVIAGGPNGRAVIDAACQRPDEPAEVIGYFRSRIGRAIPQPIKRGVADAAKRMYTEKNALKYDSDSAGYRPADVIDITHPDPRGEWQSALFKYLLDKRHNRSDLAIPESLPVLTAHAALMALPVDKRRAVVVDSPESLEAAGMTWESVAGWLQGPMDAKAWEAIIPAMGYMAKLRNLRNFEQAKISDSARKVVIDHLTNAEAILKSKQFPYRFLSAYENVESLDLKAAVEKAVDLSCQNVPFIRGRTLVLVDTSASMSTMGFSAKSKMTPVRAASLFAAILSRRAEHVDVRPYASYLDEKVDFSPATPILVLADRLNSRIGMVGHGTNTWEALDKAYDDHDRVVIITDGQTTGRRSRVMRADARLYTFNLGGYSVAQAPTGHGENNYEFGGLSDAVFDMFDLIERGNDADWPF